ncbi:hypothetical protein [Nitrolancea hollandica]|uniref:Uncharacterized protein n=1 Tax=Nitrolancea hollandica Lb TaxID=1129897 RepID=I4EMS4_9BACT|nr:hypothetical protein [Nitrolancea hollandica]CCF85987.1 membrane hypothetical protein [Nitrolancea hollandica Lb]
MASILAIEIPHYLIVVNIILLFVLIIVGGWVILRSRKLRLWLLISLAIGVPLILVLGFVLRLLGVDDTVALVVSTTVGVLVSQLLAWRLVGKPD